MKSIENQLKKLWEITFGDSREFIDLFFERKKAKENAIYIEENGQIVSALYMLPYTLLFYGTEIPVAYICGVATLPTERGKGLMKGLMLQAQEKIKEKGFILSTLIPAEPWLFDYYRSQNYSEMFYYTLHSHSSGLLTNPCNYRCMEEKEVSPEILFSYFDKKMRQRNVCMLHTYEDFLTIIEDLSLSGGKLFILINSNNQLEGMAFTVTDTGKKSQSMHIKEFLYENDIAANYLLEYISHYYNLSNLFYRTPLSLNNSLIPYGMGKMMNRDYLTDLFCKVHSTVNKEELEKMDEMTFINYLFSVPFEPAYMSLMLD